MAEVRQAVAVSRLLIERCSDPLLWYAPLVGQTVPNLGYDQTLPGWWSREPEGWRNLVYERDASPVVVSVDVEVPDGPAPVNGTG